MWLAGNSYFNNRICIFASIVEFQFFKDRDTIFPQAGIDRFL